LAICDRGRASLLKGAVFGALAGGGMFMAICGMKNKSDAGHCTVDPAVIIIASAGAWVHFPERASNRPNG
jgi:hypothetical protein